MILKQDFQSLCFFRNLLVGSKLFRRENGENFFLERLFLFGQLLSDENNGFFWHPVKEI
jgi:hypothetical protein